MKASIPYQVFTRLFLTTERLPPHKLRLRASMSPFCVHLESRIPGSQLQPTRNIALSSCFLKKQPSKKSAKSKEYATTEEMAQLVNVSRYQTQLSNVVNDMKESYVKHLSIRTDSGALDNLEIDFEGDVYPLNQLAEINHKNPQLITINLSSFPQAMPSVIKVINSSGMNLNSQQEGTMIYVKIPKVTREHREALAKNAKTICNEAKIELRNVQNRFIKDVKKKKDEVSDDLIFNVENQLMTLANQTKDKLELTMKEKQDELLKQSSK